MKRAALSIIRDEHQALAAMLRSMLMLLDKSRKDREPPPFDVLRAMLFSPFGYAMRAGRDSPLRADAIGIDVKRIHWAGFIVAGAMAGIAGALYVPQVGIINPGEFSPANSIEIVIWTAVGGRGTLVGPIIGALSVNAGKSYFTAAFPDMWLLVLGALFVCVTLFLPRGIVGTLAEWWEKRPRKKKQPVPAAAAMEAAE